MKDKICEEEFVKFLIDIFNTEMKDISFIREFMNEYEDCCISGIIFPLSENIGTCLFYKYLVNDKNDGFYVDRYVKEGGGWQYYLTIVLKKEI